MASAVENCCVCRLSSSEPTICFGFRFHSNIGDPFSFWTNTHDEMMQPSLSTFGPVSWSKRNQESIFTRVLADPWTETIESHQTTHQEPRGKGTRVYT
jgi:hypothetical protein